MLRAACIVLCLAGAGCNWPIRGLFPPEPGAPTRTIFVYNNYWHTGVVLRHADVPAEHRATFAPFADAEWSEYGWGDAEYYRAARVTSGLTLRAALIPTPSVMHVVAVKPDPTSFYARYHTALYRVELSEEGFDRVASFIAGSFEPDESGRPEYLGAACMGAAGSTAPAAATGSSTPAITGPPMPSARAGFRSRRCTRGWPRISTCRCAGSARRHQPGAHRAVALKRRARSRDVSARHSRARSAYRGDPLASTGRAGRAGDVGAGRRAAAAGPARTARRGPIRKNGRCGAGSGRAMAWIEGVAVQRNAD